MDRYGCIHNLFSVMDNSIRFSVCADLCLCVCVFCLLCVHTPLWVLLLLFFLNVTDFLCLVFSAPLSKDMEEMSDTEGGFLFVLFVCVLH